MKCLICRGVEFVECGKCTSMCKECRAVVVDKSGIEWFKKECRNRDGKE